MITPATFDDVRGMARLLSLDTRDERPTESVLDDFADELSRWWSAHESSHFPFVARPDASDSDEPSIVGQAWVAVVPRVARPGRTNRLSADIQSVFVLPEYRGHGIGSALVEAAADHATRLGALYITVHSGQRAVPVYERLGFVSSPQLLQRPEPVAEPNRV